MTQEETKLVIKDICGRLPYGIFVDENIERLDKDPVIYTYDYHPCIDNCKPYLRPMKSMTEEEKKEYNAYHSHPDNIGDSPWFYVDWLIAHHLDFRGLISKGFALEAKDDMYK